MLCLDLARPKSMCAKVPQSQHLDDDTRELIFMLTRVGMTMEDASVIALQSVGQSSELSERIRELKNSSEIIRALIEAVKMLAGK